MNILSGMTRANKKADALLSISFTRGQGKGYMVTPSLIEVVGKNIGVAPWRFRATWHEKSHPNRWLDSMVQFLGRGKFSDVAGASL